jgi:histidine triad (HIT) family protein
MSRNDDCIFCKIVAGEIPSERVFETDTVVAFKDINPLAPVHVLIIPKRHIPTINDVAEDDRAVMADVLQAAPEVAELMGVKESGYRVFFNVGRGAGQVVFHVHMHLIAEAADLRSIVTDFDG